MKNEGIAPMSLLPKGWYPTREVAVALASEYGLEVDLALTLQKFRAYHSEGQTSRNWDARFTVWVIRDVEQIRERRRGGTDDLGVPLNQKKTKHEGPQPGDPDYATLDDLAETARGLSDKQGSRWSEN